MQLWGSTGTVYKPQYIHLYTVSEIYSLCADTSNSFIYDTAAVYTFQESLLSYL
jgi:hypothetical protein